MDYNNKKYNLTKDFVGTARNYLSKGFSVIPAGKDKKPLINWKEFQKRFAVDEDLTFWSEKYGNPNIAIVTGEISSITVIDLDSPDEALLSMLKATGTPYAKTGKGYHFYFKFYPKAKSVAGIRPGVDIRSEGACVMAHDSVHPNGNRYEWILSLEIGLKDLPDFIKEWFDESGTHQNKVNNKLTGVKEGERNTSAASVIGKLLRRFPEKEWESDAWPHTKNWNLQCVPPLTEKELRTTFDSVVKIKKSKHAEGDGQSKKGKSASDKVADITFESGSPIYLDQYDTAHITVPEYPVIGIPLESATFRRWVSARYWENYHRGISGEQLKSAINSLEAFAFSRGYKEELFNRVAYKNGVLYYDLGDNKRVVEISNNGWNIVNKCPVRFRRFKHQKPQVTPSRNGKFDLLYKYANLKDVQDRLLFGTYPFTALIPDIPRPALIVVGDQGSAKTTSLRLIRDLIDPSNVGLVLPPSTIPELVQQANHNYCLFLDNLSGLNETMSDTLSGLVTGVGFVKRKLFSDDDDIIFNQKTLVGISGINLVASKADFLDRCLIIRLERIPKKDRLEERVFWKNFEQDKPYILGNLFDILAEALKLSETLVIDSLPRMADYAKVACAVAIALGSTSEEFLHAYQRNIVRQNRAAIENSPVAQVILKFMEGKDLWQGSSTDLFKLLKHVAEDSSLQIGGPGGFPKASNWLWKRINLIKTNLLELEICAEISDSISNSIITLKRSKNTSDTSIDYQNNASKEVLEASSPALEGTLFEKPKQASINIQATSSEKLTGLSKKLQQELIRLENLPGQAELYQKTLDNYERVEDELKTRKSQFEKSTYDRALEIFDGKVETEFGETVDGKESQ